MVGYHDPFIEGRTIIPACDVDFVRFVEIVKATADMEKIGGYKIQLLLEDWDGKCG